MNPADIQALIIDIMACEDTIAAAADLLGVNPTDLDDAIKVATAAQLAVLDYLAGTPETVSPIDMLDLTDATLDRTSRGERLSSRLSWWTAILAVCPLQRGDTAPRGSLVTPPISAAPASDRRTLNRTIRSLTRIVWGASMMRDPDLASMTARRYPLGDLQPVFGEVLDCARDDLRFARRAAQLRAAVDAYAATGRDHAGAALAAELGV